MSKYCDNELLPTSLHTLQQSTINTSINPLVYASLYMRLRTPHMVTVEVSARHLAALTLAVIGPVVRTDVVRVATRRRALPTAVLAVVVHAAASGAVRGRHTDVDGLGGGGRHAGGGAHDGRHARRHWHVTRHDGSDGRHRRQPGHYHTATAAHRHAGCLLQEHMLLSQTNLCYQVVK